MPTTCAVVNCHNRHCKGSKIKFYRFPKHQDRRRRWLAFVSHQNKDGSPWQPRDGDRICSDHFISKEKCDIPTNPRTNPDYVPSIQSPCSSENPERRRESDQLNRFERAQRRSRDFTERQRLQDLQIESDSISLRKAQKAFELDHGSYCKQPSSYEVSEHRTVSHEQSCSTEVIEELTIPAEVGR